MNSCDLQKNPVRLNRSGIREIIRSGMNYFIHLAALLLAAGKTGWLNAWLYWGLYMLVHFIHTAIMVRVNPEVLNERGQVFKEGTKFFDKIFMLLWIPLILVTMAVAGFDAVRFEWSHMSLWFAIPGAALTLAASYIIIWAMAVNPFFEGTVRIQSERDQKVCESGPYKFIRHPGYTGIIVVTLCSPLILGSWWAFAPSAMIVVLVIIRTELEDKTLREELPGYAEYAERVKYRLLPFVR